MNAVKQQMPTGELTLKVDEARFPLDWLIGFAARANRSGSCWYVA